MNRLFIRPPDRRLPIPARANDVTGKDDLRSQEGASPIRVAREVQRYESLLLAISIAETDPRRPRSPSLPLVDRCTELDFPTPRAPQSTSESSAVKSTPIRSETSMLRHHANSALPDRLRCTLVRFRRARKAN